MQPGLASLTTGRERLKENEFMRLTFQDQPVHSGWFARKTARKEARPGDAPKGLCRGEEDRSAGITPSRKRRSVEPEHRGEHGGDGRLRRAPSPATHSRPCPALQWENQTEALLIHQQAPALAEPTRGGGRGVLAWGRERRDHLPRAESSTRGWGCPSPENSAKSESFRRGVSGRSQHRNR